MLPILLAGAATLALVALASEKPATKVPAPAGKPPPPPSSADFGKFPLPPPLPAYAPNAEKAASLLKRTTPEPGAPGATELPSPMSASLTDVSFPDKLERVQKGDVVFLHGMRKTPTGNWHLAYAYDTVKHHGTFVYVPLADKAPLFAYAGNVQGLGTGDDGETTGMWYLLQDLMNATATPVLLAARGKGIRSELSANGIDLEAFLPGFETIAAGGVAIHHDDLLPIVYPISTS